MLLYRFAERTENHPVLLQFFFVSGGNGNGIENRVNSNAWKLLLLRQWNSELLERPEQLRINFVQTCFRHFLYGRAVVNDVLVVDLGKSDIWPAARFFHLQPIAIGLQTKLEHPLGLVLF